MAPIDDHGNDVNKVHFRGKGQARRLNREKAASGGQLGIFGQSAQQHDASIGEVAGSVFLALSEKYKSLQFRQRASVSKREIHQVLNSIDKNLGRTLFIDKSSVKPDGGLIEVLDINGAWRIILVGESKHQGNDVEMIVAGQKQGKNKDADLMVAGNAIERIHKNILEFRNLMLREPHFPYIVFLQGSNFSIDTFTVEDPAGRKVTISHTDGSLNRIDRVTASSYGAPINQNYCRNRNITVDGIIVKLQIPSLYFQCAAWDSGVMYEKMLEVAETSLSAIAGDLRRE